MGWLTQFGHCEVFLEYVSTFFDEVFTQQLGAARTKFHKKD